MRKLPSWCQRHQNATRSWATTTWGEMQASPLNHVLQSHQPSNSNTNPRLHPTKSSHKTTRKQIHETRSALVPTATDRVSFQGLWGTGMRSPPTSLSCPQWSSSREPYHCLNHRSWLFTCTNCIYDHLAQVFANWDTTHKSSFSCWKGCQRVPA